MSKRYSFECYDEDDNTTTRVEFDTENDSWSGYDGPMWKMFDFLKGCGYVFGVNDQIGVMDDEGDFRPASNE